jgi:hypothetical protein
LAHPEHDQNAGYKQAGEALHNYKSDKNRTHHLGIFLKQGLAAKCFRPSRAGASKLLGASSYRFVPGRCLRKKDGNIRDVHPSSTLVTHP